MFVDTEEEFDWDRPLTRDGWSVEAIAALPAAHARFVAAGVPLALMVDHPVATDARAIDLIGPLLGGGTTRRAVKQRILAAASSATCRALWKPQSSTR